jgi:long-chain acyl-CoA synthetase
MPAASWWLPRPVLRRFVADLVEHELVRQRRCSIGRPRPWPEDLSFEQDLGVDSLERMALATALAGSLQLHESGIEDYLLVKRTLGDWVDIAGAGLERFAARLTFRTSGSSGAPKSCPHSLDALLQETSQHALLFAGRRRILSAVPSHHIYGFLFTVLLPRALGLAADAVLDVRGSTPAWLARGAQPGDLVVGHPDFWRAVGSTAAGLPADVIGVTSTAPCPQAVSEAVEAAGLARLFHIYGSSETAGIGWRDSWREPYRLFPYWTLAPDRPHQLLRELPDGSRQEVACQDSLGRIDASQFRVGGRRDDAVQVGGINVFPSRVAAVLRRHPQVDDAVVRLMRPDEGHRLKAYLVPSADVTDTTALLADLGQWIDSQLTAPERPKAIRVGGRLPINESGKPADWSLDTAPPAQWH